MGKHRRPFRPTLATLATAYAEQEGATGDEFVIPPTEELAALSTDEVTALHARARDNFNALYADGSGLSDSDITALGALTDGIEALSAELETRATADQERAAAAAALAARAGVTLSTEETDAEGDDTDSEGDGENPETDETDGDNTPEGEGDETPDSVVASASRRGATRVPLSAIRSRAAQRPAARETSGTPAPARIQDVLQIADAGLGFANGEGVDWSGAGAALDRRLQGFNQGQYASAHAMGRQMREQGSLLTIRRPIPADQILQSNDEAHVSAVFAAATDESRLTGGSLVASGGWCAPSETLYDLLETESRDGLLSIPEVGIRRGGLQFTKGPDFAELFSKIGGFAFTEQEDIDGLYAHPDVTAWAPATAIAEGAYRSITQAGVVAVVKALDAGTTGATAPIVPPMGGTVEDNPGASSITWQRVQYALPNVVGDKPCYKVECPPFEEYRLDVDGLCITAGILQSRGYPEVLARTLRGALVAHDHRLNGKMIAQMAAGSTPVNMAAGQVGATAPLLTAIELQTEHYRYQHRLPRATTLEAIFPFWVRGAIRSDLSRRLGVDMIDVPDSRIDAWFRSRGIAPQYVYNWQAIDTAFAAQFNAWPTSVSFQLYSAGTWIRGAADIITIDTLYDAQMLGQNDFTALFTEEGWFVAKRGHDARVITVPISADGATHIGIDIAHNGTKAA